MTNEHPSESELKELLSGNLKEAETNTLMQHIDHCPDCNHRLRELRLGMSSGSWSDAELLRFVRSSIADEGLEWVGIVAQGGQGVVVEARDKVLDRRVAVKMVHPKREGRKHLDRLLREAAIAGKLEHPGIVPIYNIHKLPAKATTDAEVEQVCVLMRYLPKSHMGHEIAAFHASKLPWYENNQRTAEFRRLLTRLVQVCEAIAYAHSQSIIHCDIKPGNILVGEYGDTLVCDWGLSHELRAGATRPQSPNPDGLDCYQVVSRGHGTAGFMSPEQAGLTTYPVRQPTDVYALGAVLFQILSGAQPRIRGQEFDAIGSYPNWAPAELVRIVAKATAFVPADRYTNSSELLDSNEVSAHEDQPGGAMQMASQLQDWLDATAPVQVELDQKTELHNQAESRLRSTNRRLRVVQRLTVGTAVVACAIFLLAWLATDQTLRRLGRVNRQLTTVQKQVEQANEELAVSKNLADQAQVDRDGALTAAATLAWSEKRFAQVAEHMQSVKSVNFVTEFLRSSTKLEAKPCVASPSDVVQLPMDAILALQYSEDGSQFVSLSSDGRLITWDARSMKPIKQIPLARILGNLNKNTQSLNWAKFQQLSRDGRWLATTVRVGDVCELHLLRTQDGELVKSWKILTDMSEDVVSLDFSCDSQQLVFAGMMESVTEPRNSANASDGVAGWTVCVFNLLTLEETHRHRPKNDIIPAGIVFSADCTALIGNGCGKTMSAGRWDLLNNALIDFPNWDSTGIGSKTCVAANGEFIVASGSFIRPVVVSGDGARSLAELANFANPSAAAISNDAKRFAIAMGNRVSIYSTSQWRVELDSQIVPRPLTGADLKVLSLGFSNLNDRLVCGTNKGVYYWDLDELTWPAWERRLVSKPNRLTAYQQLPSDRLWGAHSDGVSIAVHRWEARNRTPKTVISNFPTPTAPALISADGNRLYVGRTGGQWESSSRFEQWELSGRESEPPKATWFKVLNGNICRPVGISSGPFEILTEEYSASENSFPISPSRYRWFDKNGEEAPAPSPGLIEVLKVVPGGGFLLSNTVLQPVDTPVFMFRDKLSQKPPIKHNVRVLQAAISDDEKLLATIVVDTDGNSRVKDQMAGYLTLFSLPEFKLIDRLDRKLGTPLDYGLDISPDKNLVAVGTMDGELLVWNYQSKAVGECHFHPTTDGDSPQALTISGVAFNAAGDRVLFSAHDKLRIHSPELGIVGVVPLPNEMGQVLPKSADLSAKILHRHSCSLFMGKPSADRSRVPLTGFVNGEVLVWDIPLEKVLATIPNATRGLSDNRWLDLQRVDRLAVSADEQLLAIAGRNDQKPGDSIIVILHANDGSVIDRIETDFTRVDDMCWSDDQLQVLAHRTSRLESRPQSEGTLAIWDPSAQGKVGQRWTMPLAACVAMADSTPQVLPTFSADGRQCLLPVPDRPSEALAVIDVASGQLVIKKKLGQRGLLHAFNWDESGKVAISYIDMQLVAQQQATVHRKLLLWDARVNQDMFHVETEVLNSNDYYGANHCLFVAYSEDARCMIAHGAKTDLLQVWLVDRQRLWCEMQLPNIGRLFDLDFLPGGQSLLVSGFNQGLQFNVGIRSAHSSQE